MCKVAGARLVALSMVKQERFVERGTKTQMAPELQRRMNRLVNGTHIKGWRIGGEEGAGSLVKSILLLYKCDVQKAMANLFANVLTGNYKSHKDALDRIFRIIIGCINRPGCENLFRMIHNSITDSLGVVLETVKEVVADSLGDITYNVVDNIQHLATELSQWTEVQGELEVLDIDSCFPSHKITTQRQPEGLTNPRRLCGREGEQVQSTVHHFFGQEMDDWQEDELYVEQGSSLSVIKDLIDEVFHHQQAKHGGREAIWLVGTRCRGRGPVKVKWEFKKTSTAKQEGTAEDVWLSANSLIWLLAESLKDQFVCFGDTVVQVRDGMLEGQGSSSVTQNIHFQSLILKAARSLRVEGRVQEANHLLRSTKLYIDDGMNLLGLFTIIKETLTQGFFDIKYESDPRKVEYLGMLVYKCNRCGARLGTRPGVKKHNGRVFPAGLLDHYVKDNTPKHTKIGLIKSSLVRTYRLSSSLQPIQQGIRELIDMAKEQDYPQKRVKVAIQSTMLRMQMMEPKPADGAATVQEEYASRLDAMVNATLFPQAKVMAKKKRKRRLEEQIQNKAELCVHCTAQLPKNNHGQPLCFRNQIAQY